MMKNIYTLFLVIFCFAFVACHYDDDGRYINLEIKDAFTFENKLNYVVGDTIFVEFNFSRYLDEDGYANKLDVYESSGSESFRYDFEVNKYSELSQGFIPIRISDEFLFSEKGSLTAYGSFLTQLNEDKTQYQSRVGIVLAETGRFELDLDYLSIGSDNYFDDKVLIYIDHSFTEELPNFEFTVVD